ncbi:hypothetical protein AAHB57_11665 [Bacillus cereus]
MSLLYKDMKAGTDFIVYNAELSTDTSHVVPIFLSAYGDKKMGTSLKETPKWVLCKNSKY